MISYDVAKAKADAQHAGESFSMSEETASSWFFSYYTADADGVSLPGAGGIIEVSKSDGAVTPHYGMPPFDLLEDATVVERAK